MKNYKEDVNISGLGRLQGFVNFKDANWQECINRKCAFLDSCQKSFEKVQAVECIYPVEMVEYEEEEQEIEEIDFSAALHNTTGNLFVSDILKHFRGTSTPSLTFNYGMVSTKARNDGAATTPLTDGREIARATTTNSGTDPNCVSVVTFGPELGNTLSTTVTGTPSSAVTFNLLSVTGLAIGDLVQINNKQYEITGLSGSTITLGSALDSIPTAGLAVYQSWSWVGLLTQATGSAGSGVLASIVPYAKTKNSGQSRAITFTLRIKGA